MSDEADALGVWIQILHDLCYGLHLCDASDVGTGEEQTFLIVSVERLDQCVTDAVLSRSRVADADAVDAVFWGNARSGVDLLNQRGHDCAARHAYRTGDDAYILVFCVQQNVLEFLRGIAFRREGEPCPDLDACGSK